MNKYDISFVKDYKPDNYLLKHIENNGIYELFGNNYQLWREILILINSAPLFPPRPENRKTVASSSFLRHLCFLELRGKKRVIQKGLTEENILYYNLQDEVLKQNLKELENNDFIIKETKKNSELFSSNFNKEPDDWDFDIDVYKLTLKGNALLFLINDVETFKNVLKELNTMDYDVDVKTFIKICKKHHSNSENKNDILKKD